MVIKILFFDTSALIKKYKKEKGFQTIDWLTRIDTKICCRLHFVVNQQVVKEMQAGLSATEWDRFSRDELHKNFRVVGQQLIASISSEKMELTLDEAINELGLNRGKNDLDAHHYQSMINALAPYHGGESQAIFVSSDKKFLNKMCKKGYTTINPETDSESDIRALLVEKDKSAARTAPLIT
jgi:hypothetical protein